MTFYSRYSLLIGVILLACAIVLLLSKPSTMFSREVSFMDSEPFRSSSDGIYVKTKVNLGSREHMKSFPLVIGEWTGFEYDSSYWEKYLGAKAVLLRGYVKPGLYQPVFLQVVQGETETSVHQPVVCYGAQGYTVAEHEDDTLLISDTSWVVEGAPESIPVKKMVVSKESEGQVTERRVVVYWYVAGNRMASSTVTQFEVSALAPLEGSYDGILGETKDLAAQAVPYLFDPTEGKETVMAQLINRGALGYLAVLALICVPLAVAIYPRVRPMRIRDSSESEPQK